MQTKRSTKNRSKTIRRSGRSNNPLHQTGQPVKSSVARKALGGAVFRPDLLDITLTNKSGFLIPELGFEDKPFENKSQIIESWHETLKKHNSYKTLYVPEEATLNDILDLLKNTTDKFFDGYSWVLDFCKMTNDCSIYYYKSTESACLIDAPIEWLDKHKNPLIRELGLYMIKGLSRKFAIDYVTCSWSYYELDNFNNAEELSEWLMNEGGHEEPETTDIFKTYMEYKKGRPFKLEKELNSMNFSLKLYQNRLELIKESHTRIYNWLKIGVELLQDDFSISDFEFDPEHLDPDDRYNNNEMVKLSNLFWFPFSDRDHLYNNTLQIIDDEANNCGVNDIYEWGCLKLHSEKQLVPYMKLQKLYKFFQRGNKINPLKQKRR